MRPQVLGAVLVLSLISPLSVYSMHPSAGAGRCPEGSKLSGSSPPNGFEQSCVKTMPDGLTVLEGKKLAWHENGLRAAETFYAGGVMHGRQRGWYDNGQRHFEGQHSAGQRTGIWTSWTRDGKVRAEDEYQDGELIGRPLNAQDGISSAFMAFAAKQLVNCPAESEMVWAGMPDTCKAVWCRKRTAENKFIKHGDWRCWHSSGEKRCVGRYEEGIKNGTWQMFHGNGKPANEGAYKDGMRTGLWRHWREDGSREFEAEYKNDQYDGRWVKFDEHNKVLEKGNYRDGVRQGRWTFWEAQAKKTREVIYENGEEKYERTLLSRRR